VTRVELAGRVRDVCASILFRKGEVEAAHALFWQPAPLLFRAASYRRPTPARRPDAERQVKMLIDELKRLEKAKGGS